MTRPLLGAHFSISGGLHKAVERAAAYECTALQIFTANARAWKQPSLSEDDIAQFKSALESSNVRVAVSHAGYLINPASPSEETREKSLHAMKAEMDRSARLDLPFVVLHPGNYVKGTRKNGMTRIIDGCRQILDETPADGPRLLLETTAGQGTGIGRTFEEIAELLSGIDAPDRTGVCLDTCHIFAAGYDIRSSEAYEKTMAAFDAAIGLDRLHVIHLNDAKKALDSRVDRHEHIGRGEIGANGFKAVMTDPRLDDIPKIIETPKDSPDGKDWDEINLTRLRELAKT